MNQRNEQIIVVVKCLTVVMLVFSICALIVMGLALISPRIETGVSVTYRNEIGEELFYSPTRNFEEGSPLVLYFYSLDPNATYSLFKVNWMTRTDNFSELVLEFTGVEEKAFFLNGIESHYRLLRGEVVIMSIQCFPIDLSALVKYKRCF